MERLVLWPTGPVRDWPTAALERFVAEVDRGMVIRAAAGGRFLTLNDAHTELARRRTGTR
ncbi:hypothetical protein [Rhodococcus jostii]|uniref:Uncharacterized protein n=1 Tax=Rhodococcus jostii TaxID=132919 RepID=A0A1H4ILV7_RHOJO|nr:hypothetical protein [Rhodococcus jostii]SEB34278.1 hypothetical protein SAMN04490220_0115 [Rhodococcus jostii]